MDVDVELIKAFAEALICLLQTAHFNKVFNDTLKAELPTMTGSLQHTYDPVDNAFLDATTEDTTKVKTFPLDFVPIPFYTKKNPQVIKVPCLGEEDRYPGPTSRGGGGE